MKSIPVIKTKELTKYYGKVIGIENINLEVRRKEIFGFLGPNGAGKTTFIRTILGLIQPTSGIIMLFGEKDRNKLEIKKKIGYLPESFSMYEDLKIKEMLDFIQKFFYENYEKNNNKKEDLIERFNINPSNKIRTCSKGTLQKIGIVQSFMHNPELLILDEPTIGLDPLMQEEFYKLVLEENKKGKTIFLSSHNLNEVEKICTRVGIVKNGRLIVMENIPSLKTKKVKKVEITFASLEDINKLMLEDVYNLSIDKNKLSFVFKGEIDILIKKIVPYQLIDFSCNDPTLEELFLEYYKGER
ncbi:MAG: ABC transporter ATP-binding protein [bacterium]|nr:ABC transporter ATP-binding protein [bacterium]